MMSKETTARSAISMERAMKLALEALENSRSLEPVDVQWVKGKRHAAITALREALNAPLAEQKSGIKQVIELYDSPVKPAPVAKPHEQEPVAFLANGTRFKISYDNRQSGGQIHGIPPELGGRWVAFVAADDDCHLKLTSPPQRTWVGLSDEEKRQLFDREDYQGWLDYINAIEAKLKEKNT